MRKVDRERSGPSEGGDHSATTSVRPSRLRPSAVPPNVTSGIPHAPGSVRQRVTPPVALSIAASVDVPGPPSATKRKGVASPVIPVDPWSTPGEGPAACAAPAKTRNESASTTSSRGMLPPSVRCPIYTGGADRVPSGELPGVVAQDRRRPAGGVEPVALHLGPSDHEIGVGPRAVHPHRLQLLVAR